MSATVATFLIFLSVIFDLFLVPTFFLTLELFFFSVDRFDPDAPGGFRDKLAPYSDFVLAYFITSSLNPTQLIDSDRPAERIPGCR